MLRVPPHKYGESILLAVSGGVDSLVMADVMLHHSGVPREKILVAHCNFSLRGEESDGDEAHVRRFCEGLGVECLVKRFATAAFAQEHSVSIEMAARELRYRWFDELCSSRGIPGVCVAHNANDNAETLILNLLRGTGIDGTCAMDEVSPNPYGSSLVFRPLLGFTREQIEAHAREVGISWRTDSTNLLPDCKRNTIRNEVFPIFRRLNPSFVSTLSGDIAHLREAAAALSPLKEQWRRELLRQSGDGGTVIALGPLLSRENHSFILYTLLSPYGFCPDVIASVSALLDDPCAVRSGKTFRCAQYVAVTTSDSIVIAPACDAPVPEYTVERLEWKAGMDFRTPRGVTMVDAAKLGAEPVCRPWQSGDFLCPIGLQGCRKKVSDLLTDLKYSILDKEKALVLEGEGSHVFAVIGERVDECVRIDADTTEVYRISISKGRRA